MCCSGSRSPREPEVPEAGGTSYEPAGIPARLRAHRRECGVGPTATRSLGWALRYAAGLPRTAFGTRKEFTFAGESYRYLWHRFRWAFLTERSVEVPIAARVVAQHDPKRVLEVGNVLSHFHDFGHRVVDKYEQAPGVENVDVLEVTAPDRYDLVLAISTLEHVGWDESPRNPELALEAVDHLAGLVAPGGELMLTLPCGFNPVLEGALRDGRFGFDDVRAMRRFGPLGPRWREVDPADAWDAPYDHLLCIASAVIVARRHF